MAYQFYEEGDLSKNYYSAYEGSEVSGRGKQRRQRRQHEAVPEQHSGYDYVRHIYPNQNEQEILDHDEDDAELSEKDEQICIMMIGRSGQFIFA
jgi:hypothetical protein